MYELFVLGELMTGEKHGYVLQEILKNTAGRIHQISSGTLYPLLARLVDGGLIRLQLDEQSPGGRMRKIYALTEAGRDRFHRLMEEQLVYNADTEHLFHFKMVYFQYVSKEVRLKCLNDYLQYLQHLHKHVAEFESRLVAWKPEPEKQRMQLLRVFDHHKHVRTADIEWIKQEIKRIQEEE